MRWIAVVVFGLSMTFAASVYAAEYIISPVADTPSVPVRPAVSLTALPDPIHTDTLGMQSSLKGAVSRFARPTPAPVPETTEAVLGEAIEARQARKKDFTITLLGDSMIDTLGPDGGGLAGYLTATYPSVSFTVINHGVGAENIDSGLKRLTNSYTYLGSGRNSVISEKPDIIVLESFGYNPYPLPDIGDALTKHWLKMAEMTAIINSELSDTKIIIAATIAPNWNTFGDGAPFISFSPEDKRSKTEEIKKYIENAIGFAKSEGYPLADAFHPSLGPDGNGILTYINAGDHIHYSEEGRALFAKTVAQTISANRLLE